MKAALGTDPCRGGRGCRGAGAAAVLTLPLLAGCSGSWAELAGSTSPPRGGAVAEGSGKNGGGQRGVAAFPSAGLPAAALGALPRPRWPWSIPGQARGAGGAAPRGLAPRAGAASSRALALPPERKAGVPAGCDVPGLLIPAAGKLPARRLRAQGALAELQPSAQGLGGREGQRCWKARHAEPPVPALPAVKSTAAGQNPTGRQPGCPGLDAGGAEHLCSLLHVEMLYLLDINLLDIYAA